MSDELADDVQHRLAMSTVHQLRDRYGDREVTLMRADMAWRCPWHGAHTDTPRRNFDEQVASNGAQTPAAPFAPIHAPVSIETSASASTCVHHSTATQASTSAQASTSIEPLVTAAADAAVGAAVSAAASAAASAPMCEPRCTADNMTIEQIWARLEQAEVPGSAPVEWPTLGEIYRSVMSGSYTELTTCR